NSSLNIEGAKYIANAIKNCNKITHLNLNLKQNSVLVQGAKYISNALEQLKNIVWLKINLGNNSIDLEGSQNILNAIQNQQNMFYLNLELQNNQINGEGVKQIVSALGLNQNITNVNIDLRENSIDDEGVNHIITALQQCKSITNLNLDLSYNNMSQIGIQSLSSSLEKQTKLSKLRVHLHSNKIGTDGTKALGSALLQLPNLQFLDINFQYSNIGNQGLAVFVEYLKNCTKLTHLILYLCSNKLSLEGIQNLANMVQKHSGFKDIYLDLAPTLQNGKCNCSSQFYYDSGFCQICPSNSFANSNAISQSQCSTCISNLFYLSQLATASSSAICIKCPNNTQTGTSYPTNIQDESECSLCQPGFYMQQASIPPSNGVQGKSAVCVQCPNNSSSLNFQSKVGVQFCNICQQGYYISQPATDTQPAVCLPCSSNTTNKYDISSPKQNNINDCVACAANYYPTQSNPLICQKCPNNTISNPAAFSISNCMCQPNYYMAAASSSTAAATCFPCPNGSGNYFSPIFPGDASQCDICQSGYYLISPFQDGNPGISAQCQKCPNNSTSNPNISTNVSICSLCPQNYFMQAASTSTNSAICQPCPNGSGNKIAPFQPGDESQCNICQAGYYLIQSQLNQNPKKAAQCQKCPFNSMSDIGANFISNCSQCPQNYYMQTASTPLTSATCQPCPGGSGNQQAPSIQGDLSQCNICQTGYYLIQPSSTGQATQCQQCPNNSTSDPGSLGISSCSMCLKNFYMQIASTLTTSAICQPCPTGSGTQAPVSQVGDVSQCNIYNMKGTLEEKIKNQNDPNQYVKKLIAVQKLDTQNFMHSNNTIHRGIQIQNLLIQQTNKLCYKKNIYKYSIQMKQNNCQISNDDIGLTSDISTLGSFKNSKKSTQAHFKQEVEKVLPKIQVKDLQVFRLAILKLDNQNILQRQSVQHEDLADIYQEKEMLSQFIVQLTPKSNTFKKTQECLLSNYQKTRLTAELTNLLNNKKQNKLSLMIYSPILL
ncbi:hypothetical protein ABPG73_017001, partial [Tetrahymena malaccensis]